MHPIRAARYVFDHPANRGRRALALRAAAVAQVRGRIFGRPTRAHIGELLFLAYPHTQSFAAAYANPYDFGAMSVWRRVLKPGDAFIDVGASAGAYTLWAHQLGAEVVAVEPDPDSVVRLIENLDLNGLRDTVEVVGTAISNKPGIVRFTIGQDAVGHILDDDDATSRPLPCTTIDALLGDRRIAGMKVDVEGAEHLVLAGAARLLSEQRVGVMQLEWNDMAQRNMCASRALAGDLLRAHGYRLYRVTPDGDLRESINDDPGEDVFAIAPAVEVPLSAVSARLPRH